MEAQQFKIQLFKTAKQWNSGLFYQLHMTEKNVQEAEITVDSIASFEQWIYRNEKIQNFEKMLVDECGLIYFIDQDQGILYRYDPRTKFLEKIKTVSSNSTMIFDKFTFWISDGQNIEAFSRETFQTKYMIKNHKNIVDMAIDQNGKLYVLDQSSKKITVYHNNGTPEKITFEQDLLAVPIGLAIHNLDGESIIYVLDKDEDITRFLKFSLDGRFLGIVSEFIEYEPTMITIDKNANIFTNDKISNTIFQFDQNGNLIHKIEIPFVATINDIAIDQSNNLYASTDKGIAFLSAESSVSTETGYYYSKPLDSGIEGCQWHRLSLDTDLPYEKSQLEVSYVAFEHKETKTAIDKIIVDKNKTDQEKTKSIDEKLAWEKTEKNPKDMLFFNATGRYLMLKISLKSFDEKTKPKIFQAKVIYPRISYLRYLPAIYQEDPESKEFLERFLSLFESLFYDLEIDIENVSRYFDPETTPKEFLPWLGSWINRTFEESWDEQKKRNFIKEAFALYKIRGTLEGIKKILQLYTGKNNIQVTEDHDMVKAMILHQTTKDSNFKLGINTVLLHSEDKEDPFLPFAYHFTVTVDFFTGKKNKILDFSIEEKEKYEKNIRKIIDEEKPAHTSYTLRFIGDTNDFGMWTYIGVNSIVDDYHAMQLGCNAVLGRNLIAVDLGEKGGKVERRSRIGSPDDYLI